MRYHVRVVWGSSVGEEQGSHPPPTRAHVDVTHRFDHLNRYNLVVGPSTRAVTVVTEQQLDLLLQSSGPYAEE